MQKVTLSAEARTETGKGIARSMRRDGKLPAIIYKSGKAEALTLNRKEMINFINKTRGEKALITLEFGSGNKLALMKEYQVDPVDNALLHADFMEISMDEKVQVPIRVKLVGEAIGVKRDKGIVEQLLREVEIEALPADIPANLEIDITELAAGQAIHVSDIVATEGITIFTDATETVASCALPKLQEEEEVAVEGEEGEEVEGEEAEGEEAKKADEEKKEE